jgi:hypothetical protein
MKRYLQFDSTFYAVGCIMHYQTAKVKEYFHMTTAHTSTSMAMASARALSIASHHQKQKRQGKNNLD